MHREREQDRKGVAALHLRGQRVAISTDIKAEHGAVVKILEACWAEDANKRPTATTIVTQLEELILAEQCIRVSSLVEGSVKKGIEGPDMKEEC